MNLTISRQALADALKRAGSAIRPNSTTGICRGVRLEAKRGTLALSGTDLEVYVRTEAEADVTASGVAVVNHARLSTFVSCMGGEDVELSIHERDKTKHLVVKSGGRRATVALLDERAWPQMNYLKKDAAEYAVDARDIDRAISSVRCSMAKTNDRPPLTGICIEIDAAGFTAVATDGVSLCVFSDPAGRGYSLSKGTKEATLPAFLVAALGKLLSDVSGEVKLRTDGKLAEFVAEGLTVRGRIFAEKYPAWRNVLRSKEAAKSSIEVQRSELIDALRLAANTAEEAVGGLFVRAKIGRDGIAISGTADDSTSSAFVAGNHVKGGGEETYLVNPKKLLDLASATVSDNILVRYDPANKKQPIVVECAAGLLCLLQPAAFEKIAQ